ncbi:MAG: tryptophan synthase subunit alpha [Negativicutes bacterium]|nr:tryptophan synthase subunit alpha [Negativicutes bacterium]
MTKITAALNKQKENGSKGLIVYLTAGYPDYETAFRAVLAASEAGADAIEIGMPFSDPLADGPIIQKAAAAALKGGATTAKTRSFIERIRRYSPIPLAVMTYINTVLQYGSEEFVRDFSAAGIEGLIIPDLPIEESGSVEPVCRKYGLDLIKFVAPTSTEDRIASIGRQAAGFLYCISVAGVTGVRDVDYSAIGEVVQQARRYSNIPAAIGFGIGSPQAACRAAQHADAVIVGSAVIERLMTGGVDAVREFVETIRQALDGRGI